MVKKSPSFKLEKEYWKSGISAVIGLDEVGRGAFAGPIVAAGVIYKPGFKHKYLRFVNDSKLLKPKLREELSEYIKSSTVWAIESVEIDFINENGIGKANFEVFNKVLNKLLPQEKYFILADGFNLKIPNQLGVIRGDIISLSIASASILAKVYRDKVMKDISLKFPKYGFETNVGYGTLKHRRAISEYGLCGLHRTSFNLSKYLSQGAKELIL